MFLNKIEKMCMSIKTKKLCTSCVVHQWDSQPKCACVGASAWNMACRYHMPLIHGSHSCVAYPWDACTSYMLVPLVVDTLARDV